MNIKFTGHHSKIGRVVTGFHSLDQALRGNDKDIGWPTNTFTEIFGPTGVGKTTMSLHVLGIISNALGLNQKIADLDLEEQDENAVANIMEASGYAGDEFVWVDPPTRAGKADDRDEAMLDELVEKLYESPPCLGLLDSVAAIASMSEVAGDIGDANMGRRAFPMAQFSRRVIRALRTIKEPSVMIILNHRYENMQTIGGAKSYTAPGGVVKNNLAHLRIQVDVPYVDYVTSGESKVEARWEDAWVLRGKIIKNRVGTKDRTFQIVVIGGHGLHDGLSAIIDCLAAGYAKVQTGKLIMDGTDYGNLKKIFATQRDNEDLFAPFHNELKASIGRDESDSVSDDEEPVKKKATKKKK